jgi:hypothetical protein
MLLHIKCVFIFSIFLSKAFPILRRIQLKNITNVQRSSCNVKYLDRFSKNTQISEFTKIRPVEAKFSYADGQTDKGVTDRHDKANSRFSQFCERA